MAGMRRTYVPLDPSVSRGLQSEVPAADTEDQMLGATPSIGRVSAQSRSSGRKASVALTLLLGCGMLLAVALNGSGAFAPLSRHGAEDLTRFNADGGEADADMASTIGGQMPLGAAMPAIAPLRGALGGDYGEQANESKNEQAPATEAEAASHPEAVAPAPAAGPPPAKGWAREHIGFFRSEASGKCLTGGGNISDCEFSSFHVHQRWVVDVATGFIRSSSGESTCLDVVGHPGWKDGSSIDVRPCSWSDDSDSTDQRWKFDQGGFVVNRLSGKCLTADEIDQGTVKVILKTCNFTQKNSTQSWSFVSLTQVATALGGQARRPQSALSSEQYRRHMAKNLDPTTFGPSSPTLLVFDDVARAADPLSLLGGSFYKEFHKVFGELTPSWDNWGGVFDLSASLADAGPEQSAIGNALLVNTVSNMFFAAANFVKGYPLPDVQILGGLANISTKAFHTYWQESGGCHEATNKVMTFCRWPEPKANEKIGIVTLQDFIVNSFNAKLPAHTFFETIFTGQNVPSWEDQGSMSLAFKMLAHGVAEMRARGLELTNLVQEKQQTRFAFDTEGLQGFIGRGFGFFKPRDVAFASTGNGGARKLELLMDSHRDHKDTLGLILTETVLSMHLGYDKEKKLFLLDLNDFAKYKTLPGYAPLGGRAVLEEVKGRLSTVQLEYAGETYTDFDDKSADQNYADRSALRGWRYAEKAIIATLMAKTQLLVHVKRIHLELAPALEAVTVDAFAEVPQHPMRRLLEPFISRNVQATRDNLQLWFEFRAGEFGLAPMPMEEQLRLVHDTMENHPLDLTELDMNHFANTRGMEEFTGDNVEPGRWVWKWHQRAAAVQSKMKDLVHCFILKYTAGDESKILHDTQVVAWWSSLMKHIPAVRVAVGLDKDFIVDATTTATTTTTRTVTTTKQTKQAPAPTPAPTTSAASSDGFGWSIFGNGPATTQKPPAAAAVTSPAPDSSGEPAWSLAPAPPPSGEASWITSQPPPPPAGASWVTPAPTPQSASAQSSGGFFSLKDLHPNEPSHGHVPGVSAGTNLVATSQAPGIGVWHQRRLQEAGVGTDGLSHASLERVLSTLFVWVSWIHEDVGHAAAALINDPVYTPMFIPEDGIGIPTAPLTFVTSIYRDFIFLERPKLLDPPPAHWFDQKQCEKVLLFNRCHAAIEDKQCFDDFQDSLKSLQSSHPSFSDCGPDGFFSCMGDVETSASS